MTRGTCIGKDCDHPELAKGMCSGHYARSKSPGGARLDVPIGKVPPPLARGCSITGCTKVARGRGLCGTHLRRLERTGSTDDPAPPRQGCAWAAGCDGTHYAMGLCSKHYGSLSRRRRYLKHMYGITEERFRELFVAQGERCPVCLTDTPRGDSVWHIHHDHSCCPVARSCGRCIIAILCAPCNIGMGSLGDDPDRLERAAALMRTGVPACGDSNFTGMKI